MKAMTNRIKINKEAAMLTVEVDIVLGKEGKFFIAYAPALNLVAHSSQTQQEAKKNLSTAVEMFIDSWAKSGNLQDRLAKLGWTKTDHHMEPDHNPSIPFQFLSQKAATGKMPVRIPAAAMC